MALPPPPTLVELRERVGIRVGLNTSGKLAARIQTTMDEAINRAQQQIYVRAVWARNLRDVTIPLVQGQRVYDIPDEADGVGGIMRLLVQNAEGRRWPVVYEDAYEYDASQTAADTPGLPRTWQIVDDGLLVTPAPDATVYPQMVARIMPAPKRLTVDEDRAIVEGEALVQLATLTLKTYLGVGGDTREERQEFERYMIDLRSARSGPGRAFDIASARHTGPAYWRYPSVDAGVFPYSSVWNPGNGAGW